MEEQVSETPAEKLLPSKLSRFAPPDPAGEARTRDRLMRMALSALRTRRDRIDHRLHELGHSIGDAALKLPSVRGTGLVDIDRILRKLARLDEARDQAQLQRQARKGEGGIVGSISAELGWLSDVFTAREIRTRRDLLTAELGLALCACDDEVLAEWAPHVKRLVDERVADARRVDELFIEARVVDDEFARRAREGQDKEPPKQIDLLLGKAMDGVDDVSDRLVDLGKSAAKTAGKVGTQTAWAVASGAARGAWMLGKAGVRRATTGGGEGAAGEVEADAEPGSLPPLSPDDELLRDRAFLDGPSPAEPRPAPRSIPAAPAPQAGPDPRQIPELIRELKRLVDEGILGPDEFAQKKADLLSRL